LFSTKDTDFSDMVMANHPPPKVSHIKLGNMKMKGFHQLVTKIRGDVLQMSDQYKLVRVFQNEIVGID